MFKNKFFKIVYGLILILIIIFLLGQIGHFLKPLKLILIIIFIPVLLGGFLYYLLRPLVDLLTLKIGNKNISIIITFIIIISFISLLIYFGGGVIRLKFTKLINDFSTYYQSAKNSTHNSFFYNEGIMSSVVEELQLKQRLITITENIFETIKNNIVSFFSTLTNIGTVVILIPFVLFYFLKDDDKIHNTLINLVPSERRQSTVELLNNIDRTLSTYITGQLIIAFILGFLTYIGYLLIGLPNALLLAVFATGTSFIPFIGPIIGTLPALFIGITTDISLMVKIFVVLIVVQQLEGNVIQPVVQGDRLNIHPLIVIFMVLIFVILFGFLGALFAVPTFAVIRVTVKHFYFNKTN